MNLLDVTLVAETVLPSNIEAIKCLLESSKELDSLEVLSLVDISATQKEISSGNNAVIVRVCFEHPEKMIKTEIEEYSSKASKRLERMLEELLSSNNKMFSIKCSTTKLL